MSVRMFIGKAGVPMKCVSVIVPCYNEQEVLPLFYQEIRRAADELAEQAELELLLVDDGSQDDTLRIAKGLHERDARVRYLSFSRNFGKEAALYAGLREARGDYVAVMDADLQDPPSLLPAMYRGIVEEHYDCVAARRVSRKGEARIRSFFARRFYRMMARISRADIVDGARDYRLMTRQVVDSILEMAEYNRFSKGLFGWVGYRTKWLDYDNVERAAGKTKWSFWKLVLYSMDGITSFSTAPLAIASVLGVLMFLIAFIVICIIIAKTLIWGDPVSGWPSLACILFFVGGIQLFCMGIVGQYLAKTYLETKHRPIFILRETSEKPADADMAADPSPSEDIPKNIP